MTKFGLAQPVRRVEDPRLLLGRGRYTDDLRLPGMLHGIVLRSPHAAAMIRRIDTGAVNIDVNTVFQSHMDTLLDGVHPNDEGASVLAKTIFDALSRTPSVTLDATSDAGAAGAVTLVASPTAAYGKVEKVVFYDGPNAVSEVTSSPWSYTISGVTDGAHVYRAQTVETAGRKADSPPVTVTVVDGVPVSTQVGTATPEDATTVTGANARSATAPKSSSGCALRGAGPGDTTLPGGLFLALLAFVGIRRSRRQ